MLSTPYYNQSLASCGKRADHPVKTETRSRDVHKLRIELNVASMQRHATNQTKSIGVSETFLFSTIVLNLKSSMCKYLHRKACSTRQLRVPCTNMTDMSWLNQAYETSTKLQLQKKLPPVTGCNFCAELWLSR